MSSSISFTCLNTSKKFLLLIHENSTAIRFQYLRTDQQGFKQTDYFFNFYIKTSKCLSIFLLFEIKRIFLFSLIFRDFFFNTDTFSNIFQYRDINIEQTRFFFSPNSILITLAIFVIFFIFGFKKR